MVVLVAVNKEAWGKVYHVDVNGKVRLIWPNRFGGGGTIKPGQAVRIPAEGDPFAFKMTPPFGSEFIKIVASTRPSPRTRPTSPSWAAVSWHYLAWSQRRRFG
jgi:hypothetical protein